MSDCPSLPHLRKIHVYTVLLSFYPRWSVELEAFWIPVYLESGQSVEQLYNMLLWTNDTTTIACFAKSYTFRNTLLSNTQSVNTKSPDHRITGSPDPDPYLLALCINLLTLCDQLVALLQPPWESPRLLPHSPPQNSPLSMAVPLSHCLKFLTGLW